jgi:hypothetical protein
MSSGITKGLRKTFKSITKNPWKALPVAIGLASAVFTGGSMLGLTPSWGEAMGSLASMTGATGSTASILASAFTNAGYGAALGTLGGLATGSDATTPALIGGAAGALVGGLTAGFSGAPAGTTGISGANPTAPATGVNTGQAQAMSPWSAAAAQAPATGVAAAAPGIATGAGMDPSSQVLIGGMVSGLGQGLMAGQESKDAIKAAKERDAAEAARIAGNYRTDGTANLTPEQLAYIEQQNGSNPMPADRFSDAWASGEYYWDPEAKQMKKKAA